MIFLIVGGCILHNEKINKRMKFIYITCNVSMLEAITDFLDETECLNYQVMEQVTAKSSFAEPRLNTAVWPGYNSSVIVQEADGAKIASVVEEINRINTKAFNPGELVAAYIWSVEACTPVPFPEK